MVRFVTFDIFVIGAAASTIFMAARQFKANRAKKVMVKGRFVGGPLDGEEKMILPNASYVYRNSELPAPQLYKHTGFNIYEHVGDVMEGGTR